jgi:hypothetical protein
MFDFDPPPPQADYEFVLPKADYREARYKICCLASSANSHLISFVDSYRERIENEPQGFRKFMEAQDFWVMTRLGDAGGAHLHSLAALDHFEYLQNVLAQIFELLVPEVETFGERAGIRVEGSITLQRHYVATLRGALAEFNTTYAAEIAAEKASEAFKAEQVAIAESLVDLCLAISGKWTPEYVYVESLGCDVERPGSAKLSEIAELARTGGLWSSRTLSSDRPF